MIRSKTDSIVSRIALVALALALAPGLVPAQDDEGEMEGSVELLYRSVSTEGSRQKYDEDFDGLESGLRLGHLFVNWDDADKSFLDYASLELTGLGGDPYERSRFRLGRKDVYDLKLNHRKQSYLYDLFDLYADEDAHTWDTERRQTDIDLTLYPSDRVQVFFEFQEGARTGDTLFVKDINRELFRLETPLDYNQKRYTVGTRIRTGAVDVLLRQTRRRYRNEFVNRSEGNLGLDPGSPSTLDRYDWRQLESSGADLTDLKVHAALGRRVDLTVGVFGTFAGEEELSSSVAVDASGLDFNGAPFEIVNGFTDTELEVDTTLLNFDLAVALADPVTLHLQYRSLDRDLTARGVSALGGRTCSVSGAPCSTDSDCDPATFPGDFCLDPANVNTRMDYEIDTLTGLFEFRPAPELTLTAGYRTIDRAMIRDGFGGILRDTDYESDGDETLVASIAWRPIDWLKLNADFEDGDVDRPFQSISWYESQHARIRATITPRPEMRLNLHYFDFENRNNSPDFRDPTSTFESRLDGTNWSASWWHRANEYVDYFLRYGEQDIDSQVAILFDTGGFFGTENGDSIFDNTNTEYSGRINFSWAEPWKAFVRYSMAESDGNDLFLGDDPMGFENNDIVDQEYTDWEVGLTYSFDSGIFVGAGFRDFDYDDFNNLVDYDGQILSFRAGLTF